MTLVGECTARRKYEYGKTIGKDSRKQTVEETLVVGLKWTMASFPWQEELDAVAVAVVEITSKCTEDKEDDIEDQ